MADALISVLLEQLVSITYEQIKGKVRLVLDVENQVMEFTSNLKAIQALLVDAEKRQVKEATVRDWLNKLKEVSYEMDNVLDEWNTEFLKQQVEEQENEGENILVNKIKVRFSIPSPRCFCFGQVSRVVVRRDIALKIKELNSRLTLIANERQHYHFQSTTTSGIEQPQRPKTSSLVDVSKIFGREREKSTLISMLLGDSTSTSSGEERGPLIIPVVGMGGMGKTTLAQLAYNDENVKTHFKDFSKWVCVSDPFDEIKIAKSIIDGHDTPNSDELDIHMQFVSKFVKEKRFLLVLDDVWTEDDTKWEQLKLALMSGAKGSRILVTTRKETVARMMGATTQMIHLEKLSEQICSSLFYYIAFLDGKKVESDLFEAVGNEIVKKCDGLPLAAKTLGSLMRYKNTLQEWRDVMNSEMWKIKEVEQNVFRPLLLSYYDLTSEIKRCLLFCASFSKDYKINKDHLIELWMSQNYLTSERNHGKRAIGQEYFDDLVMRSFFQDIQMDNYGKIQSCKMHDMVHDFVQFLTRNECFIIEVNQAIEKLSSDSVYHLTLMLAAESPLSLPAPFHTCKTLRSLATFNDRGHTTRIDWDLILQLKCLRALNLSHCNIKEVPKEIGELLHLRYIDLSSNLDLKELPDAMCNLCNLETLHLEGCHSLEKLPKAMGKLINLKHLYLFYCWELRGLPKGVGRLRGLRILDRFVCGGGDDKEILELGDLGSFDHLQGTTLSIVGLGNVKDGREQAQKAQLEKKKHLLQLTLNFWIEPQEQQRISDEEVLNTLRPHPDLKFSEVYNYEGSTLVFGNWIMSLQHLTHLTLDGFSYCESLPPLGKLPYLEVLIISEMRRVKKVGVELLGIEETQTSPATATATPTAIAFPKLKQLQFWHMDNWEEWEGVGDDCQVTIMPCLSSLDIRYARKLKQLPDFLLHNRPQLQFEGYLYLWQGGRFGKARQSGVFHWIDAWTCERSSGSRCEPPLVNTNRNLGRGRRL